MSEHRGKELYAHLRDANLLEYGIFIPQEVVRARIGLEHPETAPKRVYDALALAELAAVDYVRNILLGQGKYITQAGGGYRILLPSENARQVELYVSSADKKLSRALKLSRNSPKLDTARPSQLEARIHMKKMSIRAGNSGNGFSQSRGWHEQIPSE